MTLIRLNGIHGPIVFNSERFVCCTTSMVNQHGHKATITLETGGSMCMDIAIKDSVEDVGRVIVDCCEQEQIYGSTS